MKLPIPKLRAIFDVETQFINVSSKCYGRRSYAHSLAQHTLKVLEPLKAQVEANPNIVELDERNTLAIRCLGKEMTNGKKMHPLTVGCEAFGHV